LNKIFKWCWKWKICFNILL